jgi:hypothetical protein
LNQCTPTGAVHGKKRWLDPSGTRILTWDSFHGEIEVFNLRGKHVGVMDAVSGMIIKDAVEGRKIDV